MLGLTPRRGQKIGLSPGTPVHIGRRHRDAIAIELIDYDAEHIEQHAVDDVTTCFPFRDQDSVTWINVEGMHDVAQIQALGEHFGLHPLVQEDIVNSDQRPKVEVFEGYLYVVLKMLHLEEETEQIVGEQINLVLGKGFVLSFQEGYPWDAFGSVRSRIRKNAGRIRKMGADYLAHSLIDAVVDQYFLVLEWMGDKLEDIEEMVVVSPTSDVLRTLQHTKRELLVLRKAIWPLRDVLARLERGESALVDVETYPFFRDAHDHVVQVIETVEVFRDILSGILDIYHSALSNRLNEVMKTLTVFAAIFIPLTFLVGVYGMNFDHMPELHVRWAYPALWGVMVVISVGLLFFFKRKKWL